MKKKVLIICLLLIVLGLIGWGSFHLYQYLRVKFAKIEITLVDDLTLEFTSQKKVSDFITSINGTIEDDYVIDSTKLGDQEIKFDFVNDDHIKLSYSYQIKVVDTVKPVIWLGSSYRVVKGSSTDWEKQILCGDNYDPNPKCTVEGEYDLNTTGSYPLVFKAVDQNGNENTQPFTLTVSEPSSGGGGSGYEPTYTYFEDIVAEHKNEKTKIGLDVSSWQGEIDFAKIKEAGVEFMMIRVGGTRGTNAEYFVDAQFIRNITEANRYQIPVGIYFYSYADSSEGAKKDAEWVLEQIKDYQVDLPIAFDWEEWSDFNNYHLSFFGLTSMAETFLSTVEAAGYEGMLYSSKSYLEEIWLPTKYDIWLAHYTDQTNYRGNYRMWQQCSDGQIDGIDGNVDIDILYLD